MFKRRKLLRKLADVGSSVDVSYMVYINNDEPCVFPSKDDAISYIRQYRLATSIFKLQLFRIEVYSL